MSEENPGLESAVQKALKAGGISPAKEANMKEVGMQNGGVPEQNKADLPPM